MSRKTRTRMNKTKGRGREVKAMSIVEAQAELRRLADDLLEHASSDGNANNLRAVLEYGGVELQKLAADLDEAKAGPVG